MALYRSSDYQKSFESIGLLVQEKKFNIDFQDVSHLGFLIRTILATFDLQVTSICPIKFGLNWPFGSGEKVQNRFSTWQLWRPSWISDQDNFRYFDLQVTPTFPIKFQVNWPSFSGEIQNRFSRWRLWRPSWISGQNNFSYFFFYLKDTPILPNKFQVSWHFGSAEEFQKRFSRWHAMKAILDFQSE